MKLTIVMYHFVRQLPLTRYPAIKGLLETEFRFQLDYLADHYQFVTADQVMDAAETGAALPAEAVLLTFDDGYADHYQTVFPILDRRGIQGCFFPPGRAILENQVLDVNKIHFVLATAADLGELLKNVFAALDELRPRYGLMSNQAYFDKLAVANRFDAKEIIFIKRLLQRELPGPVREKIAKRLFDRYVGIDEACFSRELYLTIEQLRCMARNGMYVGSHGFGHEWMDSLPPDAQQREIEMSLNFLGEIGAPTDRWMMCYPYGAHNQSLRALLRQRGCRAALTTRASVAEVCREGAMELSRLDTNDFPKK